MTAHYDPSVCAEGLEDEGYSVSPGGVFGATGSGFAG
jgi:hypothetical protein